MSRLKNLSSIVCIDKKSKGIGFKNELLFKIKADMHHFKRTTENHNIIMGMKTYISLPGILPNRNHFVMTRNNDIDCKAVNVIRSKDEMLKYVEEHPDEEFFIIGGGIIYELFKENITKSYVTVVDSKKNIEADTFFDYEYVKNHNYNSHHFAMTSLQIERPLQLTDIEKESINSAKIILFMPVDGFDRSNERRDLKECDPVGTY